MEARCLRDPGRQDRAVIKSTCYWSAGTKLELIMEFSRSPDIGEVAEVQARCGHGPARQNAADAPIFAAHRTSGLPGAMGRSHPVPLTVLLEQPVAESGIDSHGVAGGGQVVDDGVLLILQASDEAIGFR
jgi:hypothetical protein